MKTAARVWNLLTMVAGAALWLPFALIDSMGRMNVNTQGVAGFIDSNGRLVVVPQSGTQAFTHQPAGWNAKWLAAQKNASVNVMFLGDSITVGQNLTVDTKYSFAELVRAQLLANSKKSIGAQYYACSMCNSVQSMIGSPMGNIGGSSSNRTIYGWSKLNSNATTGGTWFQTFTSQWAITAMDFVYVDYTIGTFQFVVDSATAGNPFTYTIDGGPPQAGITGSANSVTVNTIGLVNTGYATVVRKIQIYGLASGIHTLTYGNQSLSNVLLPLGVTAYPVNNSGVGFQSSRIAVGGAAALDFTVGTEYPGDRPSLYSGKVPQCDIENPPALGVAPANSGVGTFPNVSHKFSIDYRTPYGATTGLGTAASFTPALNNGVVFTTGPINTYNATGIGVYASVDAIPKLVGVIPLTLNMTTGVFTVGALPPGIAQLHHRRRRRRQHHLRHHRHGTGDGSTGRVGQHRLELRQPGHQHRRSGSLQRRAGQLRSGDVPGCRPHLLGGLPRSQRSDPAVDAGSLHSYPQQRGRVHDGRHRRIPDHWGRGLRVRRRHPQAGGRDPGQHEPEHRPLQRRRPAGRHSELYRRRSRTGDDLRHHRDGTRDRSDAGPRQHGRARQRLRLPDGRRSLHRRVLDQRLRRRRQLHRLRRRHLHPCHGQAHPGDEAGQPRLQRPHRGVVVSGPVHVGHHATDDQHRVELLQPVRDRRLRGRADDELRAGQHPRQVGRDHQRPGLDLPERRPSHTGGARRYRGHDPVDPLMPLTPRGLMHIAANYRRSFVGRASTVTLQFASPSPLYPAVAGYTYPNRPAGATKTIRAIWRLPDLDNPEYPALPAATKVYDAQFEAMTEDVSLAELRAAVCVYGPNLETDASGSTMTNGPFLIEDIQPRGMQWPPSRVFVFLQRIR